MEREDVSDPFVFVLTQETLRGSRCLIAIAIRCFFAFVFVFKLYFNVRILILLRDLEQEWIFLTLGSVHPIKIPSLIGMK